MMISQDELDRYYDARGSVSIELYDHMLDQYNARSIVATSQLAARRDIPCDPASSNCLDIFGACGALRPAFIFLHGGYWRANLKENSAFMAATMAERGIVTVVVDYTLIPHATLADIV
jgi:arylformamidase